MAQLSHCVYVCGGGAGGIGTAIAWSTPTDLVAQLSHWACGGGEGGDRYSNRLVYSNRS